MATQTIRRDPAKPVVWATADHCADRQGDERRSREMSRGRRLRLSGETRQHRTTVARHSHVASPLTGRSDGRSRSKDKYPFWSAIGPAIRAGERLGLEAEQRELRRQRAAVMRRDERVDAGDVGVDLLLRRVSAAASPTRRAPRGRSRRCAGSDPAAASPAPRTSDRRPRPMRRWNSICHSRSCAWT